MQEPYRKDAEAIKNLLIATPDGQHLPLSQFADIRVDNGASFIYREANSRFIGVQFSVRNRDLAGAVEEARRAVDTAGETSRRIHLRLGRRVQGLSGRARTDEGHRAADRSADSSDPVRAVRKSEIPAHHSLQRAGDGAGRRIAGAVVHENQFQRLFGAGIRRADGRRGADQRDSLFVHQQAAPGRERHHHGDLSRRPCCGCGPS